MFLFELTSKNKAFGEARIGILQVFYNRLFVEDAEVNLNIAAVFFWLSAVLVGRRGVKHGGVKHCYHVQKIAMSKMKCSENLII